MYGVIINQDGKRILAGGFETEEEATQLSNSLTKQGYDCSISIVNIQQSNGEIERSSGGIRSPRSYYKPNMAKPKIFRPPRRKR